MEAELHGGLLLLKMSFDLLQLPQVEQLIICFAGVEHLETLEMKTDLGYRSSQVR